MPGSNVSYFEEDAFSGKRGPGRPKGSKNKKAIEAELPQKRNRKSEPKVAFLPPFPPSF
jgi:hypothetical protein